MARVRLLPMAEAAYDRWYDGAVRAYAKDHEASDAVTAQEALEQARREFRTLLPEGPRSAGMHLFSAVDGENGAPVGMIWLGERGSASARQAFIYDIEVHPDQRGRGYGRAILAAVEAEALGLGLGRIALHVFGPNAVAIRLYETSGYEVTDLLMAKSLG